MRSYSLAALLLAGGAHAWKPQDRDLAAFNMTARYEQLGKRFAPTLPQDVTKIRGVNFGGWLISEPWMMCEEWQKMGCATSCDDRADAELSCMRDYYGNDHDAGNAAFEEHYKTWITPDTVQAVHDVGLNTIRIPIGYWSFDDIVDKSKEPFADGNLQLPYLDAVVQKAADLGIYVIIDLHGAPGAQQEDAFTGQVISPAGFFTDDNYARAVKWMSWMTDRIYSNKAAYATVGMIEVLNEPVSDHDGDDRYKNNGQDPGMVENYYRDALKAVRDVEDQRNIPSDQRLHVQFMSKNWGSGDPRDAAGVSSDPMVSFDDHNYIGFSFGKEHNIDHDRLMGLACSENRVVDGEDFEIEGEWSLTNNADHGWDNTDTNRQNLGTFFRAQQQLYEKPGMDGWVFWTWKTELNDPSWTYSYLTYLNIIPTTADGLEQNVYTDVC